MTQENQSQAPHGAEHIVKRKLARVALKKVGEIIANWQQEERDDYFAAQFLGIVFVTAVALLLALMLIWNQPPSIQLFVLSIAVGVLAGLIWIAKKK
jgi:predicted exporter